MSEDSGPGADAGLAADREVQPDRRRPALHVISGDASAEELAALIAALTARAGTLARPRAEPPSPWADRSRYLRTTLPHGPGAWRDSARPR